MDNLRETIEYGIVILNYNTKIDTINCINSILKYHKNRLYKIYIVDNGSPDGSGEELQNFYLKLKYIEVIRICKNIGFARGNNIGINKALSDGCKYIYLLNSDILLLNDAITIMNEKLEQGVAICCPAVYEKDLKYSQYCTRGISLKSYILNKSLLKKYFPRIAYTSRYYQYNPNQDNYLSGMGSGCCFGLNRSFIEESGLLDPWTFLYFEEDILAYKVKLYRNNVCIAHNALVLHNKGVSTSKSTNNKVMFTRFYRWTSSLYVLKEYANVSKYICVLISLLNIMIWITLSLRHSAYLNKLIDFINENIRIYRKQSINEYNYD